MRNLLMLMLVSALVFVIACQKPAPPLKVENAAKPSPAATRVADTGHDEHEADNAPRIALAEAKKEFDAGTAVFVDTRTEATYEVEHIKGAINIPANELEANLNKIPKGKKVIAYCS